MEIAEQTEPWYWISSMLAVADPAFNMAMDAAMLESVKQIGRPILRFYGWPEPAATFGYFQKIEDIERWTNLRPLLRRPTGGGLVPHDQDWTYSIAIPPGHPWYETRAEGSYERLHRWVQKSFLQLGAPVVLVETAIPEGAGRCFIGAEKHDLLWQGLKMAGAAQRRNRHGLLIQGSIQNQPAGLDRPQWELSCLEAGSVLWGAEWSELDPHSSDFKGIETLASQLKEDRFGNVAFNRKR